jgi:hypothetical protein
MILVALDIGSQRLFGSVGELSMAIRTGAVGPSSRIFHRVTAQWLPITTHPELRKNAADRSNTPLPPLARTRWTFFSVDSPERSEGDGRGVAGLISGSSLASKPAVEEPGAPAWRRAIPRAIRHFRSTDGA